MTIKRSFPVFATILLIILFSSFGMKPIFAVDPAYVDITVAEAAVFVDTHAPVVLDVRNQSEYDTGHIRNARLIPLWELSARLSELSIDDEILAYCNTGERSADASQILVDAGYSHIYHMLNGTVEWIREGYPMYVKYPSVQEAIDNASTGETLYISAGLYSESLILDKSLVLKGEDKYMTIIDAAVNTTVCVTADNVSISDFTLRYTGGCACYDASAAYVKGGHNINITNNVIVSDDHGLQIVNAGNMIIARNNITCPGNTFIVVLNSSEILMLENSILAADGMELDNCVESVFSGNYISSLMGAAVFAYQSSENTFSRNEIVANASVAISLSNCYNNTFLGNNVSSSTQYGLFFWGSNSNSFYHNNFFERGGMLSAYQGSSALWDNGFEGNFWNSYTGVDADLDGIGDTPYVLDSANRDHFPLTGMFHSFNTVLGYEVDVVSDSAIDKLEYVQSDGTIRLQVSSMSADQTVGYCRISIPHNLIDPNDDSISVVIDDGLTSVLFLNSTLYDNGTHRWIYFTYAHSTHEILIVPQYPNFLILTLFMVTTVATAVSRLRRRRNLRSETD